MKKRQKIRKGLILVSFFLFPASFYYLSPALIIQASAEGVINGSFIFFILLFLSSLLLGRAFCGWVCPAAGCQEAIIPARDKKVTRGNIIKWILWIPWLAVIILFAVRSGGYSKLDIIYQTTYGFSIGSFQSFIAYLVVLFFLIVIPAFSFGKRSFCHHLCWMAPFMITGRKIRNLFKWPSLRLASDPDNCIHCHRCSGTCPMSLEVEEMVSLNDMENHECILCGNCVDGCDQNVIRYSFR